MLVVLRLVNSGGGKPEVQYNVGKKDSSTLALELPVYHIIEPQVKAQIDLEIYKEHLELTEIALDVEIISQALNMKYGVPLGIND
jgi:hypothetical protein